MSESSKASALPAPLLELCQAELDKLSSISFCGWEHAESRVWEVVSSAGERAFLKQHRQARKFEQERRAYLEWCPKLGPQVPRLLACRVERPQALLLSAVPGSLAEATARSSVEEADLHRQAGAFLRRLHDLPFEDDDSVPVSEAMLMRSEAWAARAEGVVEERDIAWVKAQVAEAAEVVAERGWRRVPSHRDYTARNWLWDGRRLYVIDFEHSRPQLWFMDVQRLWAELWRLRPELEEAFWEGYGRELTHEERWVLERDAAHSAMSTVIWAREHGDAAFEARGWEMLERLKAPRSNRDLLS